MTRSVSPSQMSDKSKKTVGKPAPGIGLRVAFSIVAFVLVFATIELVLGLAGIEAPIAKGDPLRGFSDRMRVFERDGDSFRTRPDAHQTFNPQRFAASKPADGLRVFVVGGSSAFGFPWGAEVAFSGLLEGALREGLPGRTVEVVNAAGTSYALHRVGIVVDEILDYEPDALIVYSGHNEFVERALFQSLRTQGELAKTATLWTSRLRLRGLLERVLRPAAGQESGSESLVEFDVDVRRDETQRFSSEEKARVVTDFEANLVELVSASQARGVRVLLATVPPNLRQWRPEASISDPALDSLALAEFASALGEGRVALDRDDPVAALEFFRRAVEIDAGHAEAQFLYATALEAVGQPRQAAAAFAAACDADASPIRSVSAINDVIRSVAARQSALLVDVEAIFAAESHPAAIGFDWIEDYVHPTQNGHARIAWEMLRGFDEAGWFAGEALADREVFAAVVAARREPPSERNATWFYNQAVILRDQGRFVEAIAKYRDALAIAPDYGAALLNLGKLLGETGRAAEAVPLLKRLVRNDPDQVGGYLNLGNAYQAMGDFEGAADQFRLVLDRDPSVAFAHNNLGNALQAMGRFEEALPHYQEALTLRPGYANAHVNRGNALASLGRFNDALSAYAAALDVDPTYLPAHRNAGLALARVGRFAEAHDHFAAAHRLSPDDSHLAELEMEARRRANATSE